LPELLTLGQYDPETLTGPGIWLRCAIAGKIDDFRCPPEHVPIVYLPGVGKTDLNASETCPDHLISLAELQYRGSIWLNEHGRDWLPEQFLASKKKGLGLNIAKDETAKNSLHNSLHTILLMDLDDLKGKHLDDSFFNSLIISDPDSLFLRWLNDGDSFRKEQNENSWKAFVKHCEKNLKFNPDKDGSLKAAELLAFHQKDSWKKIWNRFCEAPERYKNIPEHIRSLRPPDNKLSWRLASTTEFEGFPQWNDFHEKALSKALANLSNFDFNKAKTEIINLDTEHSGRRSSPEKPALWDELGQAPLARALGHLTVAAKAASTTLTGGALADLEKSYVTEGWKVDDGVMKALSEVRETSDIDAVISAVKSFYLPWLEESAKYLQTTAADSGYPAGRPSVETAPSYQAGDLILFVDGLRFDAAKNLSEKLSSKGFNVTENPLWAALPSVTATGKAAASPVRDKIKGLLGAPDFTPVISENENLLTDQRFKQLLVTEGWTILDDNSTGDGEGKAWCENGSIDHAGHSTKQIELASQMDYLLERIVVRVRDLSNSGWKKITIVTDHGFLFLPVNLPKSVLPSVLTEDKWGRCASIKPGAKVKQGRFPWHWNQEEYYALANGVSCFRDGLKYSHGGLSLQECLTLRLTVIKDAGYEAENYIQITDIKWTHSRCAVTVSGKAAGFSLDIRGSINDPESSLAHKPVEFKPAENQNDNIWTASAVYLDPDPDTDTVIYLVVLDKEKRLKTYRKTVKE
ncbi:MAG: BREX-1 system phosphatase PglZ type B, partial [Deltaproteobacteria bacterium]|nr:BREX-1 system phosphatase PglZ type B [Deltaproteobacteria bacterium]